MMRSTKLSLCAAGLLCSLGLSGCGSDLQYNPGPRESEPGEGGAGGDESPDTGGGHSTAPALGGSVKAGIGKWAEIGGSGQTGGGETAGGGGSGGQTGGGQATGGGTTGGGAGGGQAGGGGGGPPPEPPPNDGCLGEPVALSPGLTVEINGTLVGAADDLTTFCADVSTGPGNPDVVYQLDVAADVSLRMRVVATEFDPALSLRLLTCEVESSGDACLNFGNGAEATGVSLAAGTYWVVIDSADGNAGEFVLELAATTPVCGDGILNPGEQCDKGPGIPDDGCRDPGMDAECTFGEEPGSTAQTACPGLGPVEVKMSADPLNPHIQRLGPFYNGTGGNVQTNATTEDLYVCGWAAQGPENVFHVVPESSGTLFARIGYDDNGAVICDLDPSCGDFILYMRQTSCDAQVPEDPLQQLACVDFDDGFQEILVIQAPVTGGSDYWVFVDGLDTTYGLGLFHLELWLVP